MKRFGVFALLLSLGAFTFGCGEKANDKAPDGEVIIEEGVVEESAPEAGAPEKPAEDAK